MSGVPVRPATVEDISAMVAAGARLHAVAPSTAPYLPGAVGAFVRRAIVSRRGAAWLLANAGETGGLFATFDDHPFGFGLLGTEWALWVPEGSRGLGAARALIAAYEAEGRARGCHSIQLTALATNPRAASLYRRLGFVEQETHFAKAL